MADCRKSIRMEEHFEYVTVPFPEDEDEPQHPELDWDYWQQVLNLFYSRLTRDDRKFLSDSGISDVKTEEKLIDPNDPRLIAETVEDDPEANAFATSVTLRVMPTPSIAVEWQ